MHVGSPLTRIDSCMSVTVITIAFKYFEHIHTSANHDCNRFCCSPFLNTHLCILYIYEHVTVFLTLTPCAVVYSYNMISLLFVGSTLCTPMTFYNS